MSENVARFPMALQEYNAALWKLKPAMGPALFAPILITAMIAEYVDKRIGLKCQCGKSLTAGPHVVCLMREGGKCPRCERVVVESET